MNRTACVSCTGTAFSAFGQACAPCSAPNVVNMNRTTCSACLAGTGPNQDRDACTRCYGNTHAVTGSCEECFPGKAANPQKTQCEDVGQLTELLTDMSVVEDIIGENSSTNLLVQTTLGLKSDLPLSGSAAYHTFAQGCVQDLASALDLPAAQLTVTTSYGDVGRRRVQSSSGSSVDKIFIVIDSPDAASLLRDLVEQLQDQTSMLRTSTTIGAMVDPDQIPTFDFVCPVAMIRAAGDLHCASCGGVEVPNLDQSACIECSEGTIPSADRTACVCASDSYSVEELPIIRCIDLAFDPMLPTLNASASGCISCAASGDCVTCSSTGVTLNEGYQFLDSSAAVEINWHAFKCPTKSACPEQDLRPVATGVPNNASSAKVNAAPCMTGSTGHLCGICADGWKKGPAGSCSPCDESNGGWLNPLLLIPAAIAGVYIALRTLLTAKRQKRIKALGAAKELFADIDVDQSGEITRDELRQGLSLLYGANLMEETVAALIEQIDLDHDGRIDEHEFVAWLEHSRSGMQVNPAFSLWLFVYMSSRLIQDG